MFTLKCREEKMREKEAIGVEREKINAMRHITALFCALILIIHMFTFAVIKINAVK